MEHFSIFTNFVMVISLGYSLLYFATLNPLISLSPDVVRDAKEILPDKTLDTIIEIQF